MWKSCPVTYLSHPHPSKQSKKGFLSGLALFFSHHNRIIIVEIGMLETVVWSMSNIRTLKSIIFFFFPCAFSQRRNLANHGYYHGMLKEK